MKQVNLRVLAALVGVLVLPVHDLPVKAAEEVPEKGASAQGEREGKGVEATASYYARKYQGRRTTSGVRYDDRKLTAAHQSLPLGTKVRVVNPRNSSEVVVTVNDRCRKRKLPFIDLSREAARQLGFLGKGTAKVLMTPLTDSGES